MREYLRLHGISWQERILKREKQSVAELLLKAAREDGYDLLVIGGYGHTACKRCFADRRPTS